MEDKKINLKETLFSTLWILSNTFLVYSIISEIWHISWFFGLIVYGTGQSFLIGIYSSPSKTRWALLSFGWVTSLIIAHLWLVLAALSDGGDGDFMVLIIIGTILGLGQWFVLFLLHKKGFFALIFSILGMIITAMIVYINNSTWNPSRDTLLFWIIGSIAYGIVSGIPFSILWLSNNGIGIISKRFFPKLKKY